MEPPIITESESRASRCHGINMLEGELVNHPPAETKLVHRFTPGLYIREIHIPKGTMGTTMIHKFEHPFVVSKGRLLVTSENEGSVVYEAPYCGITPPGTRRAIYADEDSILTTFHVTDLTDIDEIVAEFTDTPCNPMLDPAHPALNHWRESNPQPLGNS